MRHILNLATYMEDFGCFTVPLKELLLNSSSGASPNETETRLKRFVDYSPLIVSDNIDGHKGLLYFNKRLLKVYKAR